MASTDPATDTRRRFSAEELRQYIAGVLRHYEVPERDAALGAEVLIDADLSGIESHGIAHLPRHPGYATGFQRGIVNPNPNIKVLRETPVSAAWDGDSGTGVIVCTKAMHACIEKAKDAGIGMVTVTNGRHFGAAGYYARIAAEQDLIGMAYCNVPPIAGAKPEMILARMIIEIPLPIPRSVICSPSHIKNNVPVTSVTAAVKTKSGPGAMTTPSSQTGHAYL